MTEGHSLPTPSSQADERTRLISSSSIASTQSDKPKHHNLADLSPFRFRLVCGSLWLATFLVALDGTLVATLLSDIGSVFHASNQSSWLGTAYLLSLCAFTPIYGRLSDIIGRRNAHLLGMGFFTLGTVLCAVAPSMWFLIGARCVAGIGGGGITSVSTIIMSDLVDLHHRGLFQGYVNIFYGLGAALGGPAGGWISDTFGWRMAFVVQIPILVLAAFLVYTNVRVPQSSAPKQPPSLPTSSVTTPPRSLFRSAVARIDSLGSITLVGAVGTLLLGFSLKTSSTTSAGAEYAWTDPMIWGLLLASLVLSAAFILVEGYYATEPILPLSLLTRRTPIAVALTNFLMVMNSFSVLYNVPLYFTAVRLESSSIAGAHLLPNSILIGAGSLAVGYTMRKTGKYYWAAIVCALIILTSSVMLVFWNKDSPAWLTWVGQAPGGFGYAGVLTTTLVALMTSVTREGKGEM
jgi:MFS family permease